MAMFPGISNIVDGSEAIAFVESKISEAACAYPITPSTTMASVYQAAVANGDTNLWGTPLRFLEPESEHSSASAAEGVALAGGRVTNFTAGQGLILMKEVLYVISGKRLPVVFHIGARALTSQSLNIHAGHDDVMGVTDVGWGMLFARNAQEAADLTAIARRAAEEAETPFFVVQDGFLTTHTLENVLLPEDDLLRSFVGDPRARIRNLFDPGDALMTGTVQNQDSYMKGRIAQRSYYDQLAPILSDAFAEWGSLTGRQYGPIACHRTDDADEIIVAMGTIADGAIDVVDHLRAEGRRAGCVAVTSFRPFPAREVTEALSHARVIAVIERTDDPAAVANPLTREIKAALYDRAAQGRPAPAVLSVSAGLGSRDVAPGDILAVFDWLARDGDGRDYAVLGIRHPAALERVPLDILPADAFALRGHSVGGFGSVTTNKILATLVGEALGLRVQAYPRYGSEKKGLPTTYFLIISRERIRSHTELDRVNFVPLHDVSAFAMGNPLAGLQVGGTIFVQSALIAPDDIWASIPARDRAEILDRGIRVIALDTAELARQYAPRPDLVVRMQGIALIGIFLRVAPFAAQSGMTRDEMMAAVRSRMGRFFGKRAGVVDANMAVIEAAYDHAIDVTGAIFASEPPVPSVSGKEGQR
jgi:pyruvate-ferredoxin/flavodoxin oxidoreductase